jgi:hypothetical protein
MTLRLRTLILALACAGLATPVLAAPDTTPLRARAATLEYARPTPELLNEASRYAFVILHFNPRLGPKALQSGIDTLKTRNPRIKLAQYTILNEWMFDPHDADLREVRDKIDAEHWWARDADTHALTQWTQKYGAAEVNPTALTQADADGLHWPQWKARHDWDAMFRYMKGLDYVFNDNVIAQPRVHADWLGQGRNQPPTDTTMQHAYRLGFVDFWNTWRQVAPQLKIMGNADNELNSPEFKGRLDGAFNECLMGKDWSLGTNPGWAAVMKRYTATFANTRAPHDVIFQICSPHVNYELARYGLASALLNDGYFAYTVDDQPLTPWLDEFDAPLGVPAEAPPTQAAAGGVWMRRYTHGLVLVNPAKVPAEVDLGPGYCTVSGSQSPEVNTGKPVKSVTLKGNSGLILVGCAASEG